MYIKYVSAEDVTNIIAPSGPHYIDAFNSSEAVKQALRGAGATLA
jgi:hypothetical protein